MVYKINYNGVNGYFVMNVIQMIIQKKVSFNMRFLQIILL